MLGDLGASDATELAQWIAKGKISAHEALDAALMAVEAHNEALNAVVLIQEDIAREAIDAGLPDGPFKGVPFLLKDLGCEAKDFPAHCGSRLYANTTYEADNTIFKRMKTTGLNTFGRTTVPESAVGIATEAVVYGGPTRNPWNLEHTPGGSSGGAAAAVAAGIVAIAHGSDGGGSVRVPASNCGLFGMKPTRGRLPDGPYAGESWGGMAIDGFLSHSVRDSAVILDATSGPEVGAPYWAPPLKQGFVAAIQRPPKALRIAICDTTFEGKAIDPEVAQAVRETGRLLESLGHYVEVARPRANIGSMMRAWTDIVAVGTALSLRARFPEGPIPEHLVERVCRTAVIHAESLPPTRYLQAIEDIHDFGREMAYFFEPQDGSAGYDILLNATIAELPAKIGRFAHSVTDYVDYRLGEGRTFDYSPFAAAFNASGQPAASLPLGQSASGLPIGVHLSAAFGADELLIALCAQIEAAAPWVHRRAPL